MAAFRLSSPPQPLPLPLNRDGLHHTLLDPSPSLTRDGLLGHDQPFPCDALVVRGLQLVLRPLDLFAQLRGAVQQPPNLGTALLRVGVVEEQALF